MPGRSMRAPVGCRPAAGAFVDTLRARMGLLARRAPCLARGPSSALASRLDVLWALIRDQRTFTTEPPRRDLAPA
ncbi:hypothetical protein [Streptantibioticus ferralitis]|uniref:Transposase n=1 Tax=Streptantibioticus ferralitis TaxID=236510 RepID=A0ABT5Z1D3_9ACTN|nr:hypothetical protein [Streptantibioticus ferralitis]MDF2257447.1 hypothetical protein [Streptantibioticus ferralitis]